MKKTKEKRAHVEQKQRALALVKKNLKTHVGFDAREVGILFRYVCAFSKGSVRQSKMREIAERSIARFDETEKQIDKDMKSLSK